MNTNRHKKLFKDKLLIYKKIIAKLRLNYG